MIITLAGLIKLSRQWINLDIPLIYVDEFGVEHELKFGYVTMTKLVFNAR